MAEPNSPPPMNFSSSSIAPLPLSPPTSPLMNSPSLSIAPPFLSHLHSQPASPPMNSPYEELIHNSKNFGLSQVPVRIMFYLNKCWQDFNDEVLESLRNGFANRKTFFPIKIEGIIYVFDFLGMIQVHLDSMSYRSIAWIDEKGNSFFPVRFIDHDFSKIIETNENGKRKLQCEEHVVVAKQICLAQTSKFPNAKLLNKSDKTYAYINNLFMNNVVDIDPHATITSIHEFQISTPYGRACWDSFEKTIEITKVARGKANVVYGWHATPAEKVASIFSDGFKLLPKCPTLHPSIGAGIFLANLESPQHSGMQYKVDKDEEKHLILCRVALGSVERLFLECDQTNSSSERYDTACEDPNNPKWYAVWADDINKRILPVCVVSCKTSAIQPAVEWNKLPHEKSFAAKVFLEIKKRLPIELIPPFEDIYDSYKKDLSTSSLLVYRKRVRALIGEEMRKQIMMDLYLKFRR